MSLQLEELTQPEESRVAGMEVEVVSLPLTRDLLGKKLLPLLT